MHVVNMCGLLQEGANFLKQSQEQFFQELDVSPLHSDHLKPLSKPVKALSLDFRHPPSADFKKPIQVHFPWSD